jgi:anti-sigma factor RsiW
MNTNLENGPSDDRRFDRLVDGELSETERRELLSGLDSEPAGWRRCAMAFLEAQCWKQEFSSIARGSVQPAAPRATAVRRASWLGGLTTPLAVAATFLLALWLGTIVQYGRVVPPAAPSNSGLAAVTGSTPNRSAAGPSALNPWQVVTVSTPPGSQDGGRSFDVPAMERDNVDPQWLQNLPPAIPDNVLQAFSRTGHHVQQHRELVPIPLNDGRRLIMPVDQVDIQPVGNPSY